MSLTTEPLTSTLGPTAPADLAAERERSGGYGICAGCDQPIPAERLEIFPATTQCVACKSAER